MLDFVLRAASIVLALALSYSVYPTKHWVGGVLAAVLAALFIALAAGEKPLSLLLARAAVATLVLSYAFRGKKRTIV
jgi:hypothetical protein